MGGSALNWEPNIFCHSRAAKYSASACSYSHAFTERCRIHAFEPLKFRARIRISPLAAVFRIGGKKQPIAETEDRNNLEIVCAEWNFHDRTIAANIGGRECIQKRRFRLLKKLRL